MPQKLKEKLGWEPTKTLEDLITEMLQNDREIVEKQCLLIKNGYKIKKVINN